MKILLLILMTINMVSAAGRFSQENLKGRPKGRRDDDDDDDEPRWKPGAHSIGLTKLKEKEFASKGRYVVSSNHQNTASMEFDINLYPYNFEAIDDANFIRVYVIVASSEVKYEIDKAIQMNEDTIERNNLPLCYLLGAYMKDIQYYKQIDMINGTKPMNFKNQSMHYNEYITIKGDGAVYTFFIFEEMTKEKQAAQLKYGHAFKDQIRDGILKFPTFHGGKRRLEITDKILDSSNMTGLTLKKAYGDPYGRGYPTWKSVIVRGKIYFKNGTGGYLSGDVRQFRGLYTFMFMVYMCLTSFWVYKINWLDQNITKLHLFLNLIVILTLFETLFNLIYLGILDNRGVRNNFLAFMINMFEVLRNTFARFITTIVSLGYYTIVSSVEKYHGKIAMACAFYAVSLAVYLIVEDLRHNHIVLPSVNFLLSMPVEICNLAIMAWIFVNFRTSLQHFKETNADLKHKFMTQMAQVYGGACVSGILFGIIETIVRLSDPDLDSIWGSTWWWDKYPFFIFTLMLIGYIYVLQPSDATEAISKYSDLKDDINAQPRNVGNDFNDDILPTQENEDNEGAGYKPSNQSRKERISAQKQQMEMQNMEEYKVEEENYEFAQK